MGILPHHQVREQRHRLARGGQAIKRRHRRFELIADPVHVDHQERRLLGGEAAFEESDHPRLAASFNDVRTWPRSAWQTAAANASAASAATGPSSFRMLLIMSCTCAFSALPVPTTACLIWRVAYSNISAFASTVPQIAAPRAWPNFKALSGFRLTNTRSIAISCGRYCATTVRTQRNISHKRTENSPCWVRMTPLAT